MDVCKRGQEIYETKYKDKLEPAQNGRYAVINVATKGIEILEAFHSLEGTLSAASRENTPLYVMRIGFPALFTIG